MESDGGKVDELILELNTARISFAEEEEEEEEPRLVVSLKDVTERKRAEAALAASEANLTLAQALSRTGSWEHDFKTQHGYWSSELYRLWGRKLDQGVPTWDEYLAMLHPESRERIVAAAARAEATGQLVETEIRSNPELGPVRWFIDTVRYYRDADGRLTHMTGTVTDITERKRMAAALRESEERYRSLVEEMPLGLLRIAGGPQGRVLFANPALAWMLGYTTVEELQQVALPDLYSNQMERAEVIMRLLRDGGVENHELNLRKKDGNPIRVRLNARATRGADGRIRHTDGIIEDLTVTQQFADQLRQAQKMEAVGRLAGGIAHDFNNILCIILNNAELGLGEHPQCENMIEIKTAALRSAEMVRQLLAFSRKQVTKPKSVVLNGLIADYLRMLRRLIGEDITVTFQPAAEPWRVRIDPAQVGQILTNLAANARDAIAGVGAISIWIANVVMDAAASRRCAGMAPGEYVRLTFSDTGKGMAPEVLNCAFEPFFTTKAGKGTGLGLATVYGIAKQNDGFIYAESEPGRGTSFTLYLPRIPELYEPTDRDARLAIPRGTETVLVVDDEEKVIKAVKTILAGHGYTVLTAATAAAACRLANAHPGTIHLLLVDVIMPEMNGREAQQVINALRPGIRTLFMSGHPAEVLTHRGVLDPGVRLIEKPFTSDALLREVRAVLDGEKDGLVAP